MNDTLSKPPTITSLVFDFGGVIFINPQHPNMSPIEHDEIWAAVRSVAKDFQADLLAGTMSFETLTQVFHQRTPRVHQPLREHVLKSLAEPNAKVLSLIDHYHQQFPIYGLVNASPGWTEIRRGINGLDRHFTRVVPSHEVNVRKPDPEIFRHFLKVNNLRAQNCLFIDDQPENVQAAGLLGFHTHHFTDVDTLEHRLKVLADQP
ncbi:MAG: HAD-IA family hydrolase [Candidatus Kerfeldbacteria bacterium]|nr:HAD-IA family hydrolase [Candidatus Kerfeldbacteria bacterium]